MTETTEQPRQRAAVYQLFARLWAKELSHESVNELAQPEICNLWLSLGGVDPSTIALQLSDLAEQYCRLFVGPIRHLPPVQSVWTSGELQSDVVAKLTEFAMISGYNSPWPELLPDHLANQLQLMSVILEKSVLESDDVRQELAGNLARAFLERHLSWPRPFFERIRSTEPNGFYDCLATLTQTYLETETLTYKALKPQATISNDALKLKGTDQ